MANLDGDFVALNAVKSKRPPKKHIEERPEDFGQENVEENGNLATGDSSQELAGIVIDQDILKLNEDLFTAAGNDDVDGLKKIINQVKEKNMQLCDGRLRHPQSNMNVLHAALDVGSNQVATHLISTINKDVKLLIDTFEIKVKNHPSQKTNLHILSEKGDIDLIRKLLDKIPEGKFSKERKDLLSKTVLMEIEGQRPRHLSCIHIAALKGYTEILKYFVKIGIPVNLQNNKNDTPILWAARWNHIDTVRALIKLKADLNLQNDKGSTPLYWATRYGFTEMVEVLVKEGKADVHQKRKLGLVSPLILGASFGYTRIVEILLANGLDVNLRINNGYTALHHASEHGNAETVNFLLDKGADIEDETAFGDTAIILAAQADEYETVEILATRGADTEKRNREGKSIWHYAVEAKENDLLLTVVRSYRKIKQIRGKNLTLPTGKTALHIAAALQDIGKIDLLLRLGVDYEAKDETGNTFFHLAARENSEAVVNNFIGKIDVNAQNNDGNTALHLAAYCGHLNIVQILTQKAKVEIRNENGETALHSACKSETASEEVISHIVKTIVNAHNWDLVDAQDVSGNTGLHLAARTGRTDTMEVLKHLNPRVRNYKGDTPFHIAARGGSWDQIATMLPIFKNDVKINQGNESGDTLLHIAANNGDAKMLELLVHSGADLASQDFNGMTVCHILVKNSAEYPHDSSIYENVFNTVIDNATRWWSMKQDRPYPDEDSVIHQTYRKQAVLLLTSELTNSSGHTVLLYAAHCGSLKMLKTILNIPNVYMHEKESFIHFDVTDVFPGTISNASSKKKSSKNTVGPISLSNVSLQSQEPKLKTSCLDIIVQMEDIQTANQMFDIIPIKQVVDDYWGGYSGIYIVLLLIHVTYMLALSITSLPSAYDPTRTQDQPIYPMILFLLWPGILMIYEVYHIVIQLYRFCRSPNVLKEIPLLFSPSQIFLQLSHLALILFCVSMAVWFYLFVIGNSHQIHVLSIALLLGWMFSLVFTDGFESVHALSIMLKNIIIRDMTRFFVVYLFILVGVSTALAALFWPSDEMVSTYPSIWHVLFLVFNLMIGMGDVFDEEFDARYQRINLFTIGTMVKCVYLFYVVMTTIILLNLLIAMMTDSYTAVKIREGSTWRVGSVRLAMQFEKSIPALPHVFRFLRLKKTLTKYDKASRRWMMRLNNKDKSWEKSQENMTEEMKAIRELKQDVTSLRESLNQMSDNMESMMSNLENSHQRQDVAAAATAKILQAYKRRKTRISPPNKGVSELMK